MIHGHRIAVIVASVFVFSLVATSSFGQFASLLTVTKDGTGTGTVTSMPAGISCGGHCSYQYSNTALVTLNALADSGSNFAGWQGCDTVYGDGTCAITMTWDATITATFEQSVTLDVTRTGTGTGTITGAPGGISCGNTCSAAYWPSESVVVTLTANADSGSGFAGWTGCPLKAGNTCTITMTAAATVSGAFALDSTVTVSKTGTGTGTATSAPPGIDCGNMCSYLFDGGTALTLVAAADVSSTFQGWTGCDSVSSTNCYISVSADVTSTAQFGLNAILNVARVGGGTGVVTNSPSGTSCGAGCYSYAPGTAVKLTAVPDDHNVFQGWTGCPSASGKTCSITMTADANISAQFEPGNVVAVTKPGLSGTGVTSNPTGLSCFSSCTEGIGTFLAGQDVTLYATSTNHSLAFAYWTGDCAGTRPCRVTLDRDMSVGAVFVSTSGKKYTLAITKTKKSAGDGIVESYDETIHCGSACRNSYYMGTPMSLTATPDTGSTFMGWAPSSVSCPGTNPCLVTMGSAKTVRATFIGPQKLTVRKQHVGTGNGTVQSDPPGIDFDLYGTSAQAYFLLNAEVTLTAEGDVNSVFTGWKPASLNCPGTDPCVITMDKARNVTAVFTKPKSVSDNRRLKADF